MSARKPVHDHYDAFIGLGLHDPWGAYAFALVKYNFSYRSGAPRITAAAPLEGDPSAEENQGGIPPFTDFWPYKLYTDVIVCGQAYAPGGRPAPRFDVSVAVGDRIKALRVFGPRTLRVVNGQASFSPPEPVAAVPLTREEAYGGTDKRVEVDVEPGSEAELALKFDHPGLYPRNEEGRGYLVVPEDGREVAMPALENPRDLLRAERAIARSPDEWYRLPLPWFLDRTSLLDFPRMAFSGLKPWFLGPEDRTLPEVARGDLPENYRKRLDAHIDKAWFDIRMRQEASYDMTFSSIEPGLPIECFGLHREKPRLRLSVPQHQPHFEFNANGKLTVEPARLHQIVCYPDEERCTLVFSARHPLTTAFIPGVQRGYDLSVRIDRSSPIHYDPPPPPPSQLDAAKGAS